MDEKGLAAEGLIGPVKLAWIRFLKGVLDPWVLILLAAAFILFAVAQAQQPGVSNALAQLLLAISTGVLGARIANRFGAALEEGVLFARGKVSVRGLKILLRHLSALEDRAATFLARHSAAGADSTTARDFEEIVSSCRQLQEQAISSIENWTDVVPEANIATAIGEISAAKSLLDEKERDIAAMKADYERQVDEAREQNLSLAQVATGLAERISSTQKEANELKRELEAANYKLLQSETKILRPLSGIMTVGQTIDHFKPVRNYLAGGAIPRPRMPKDRGDGEPPDTADEPA